MSEPRTMPPLGRVLIVLGTLDVGGAERQGVMLAARLAVMPGTEVEVWGMRTPGTMTRELDALGLRWRCVREGPIHDRLGQARLIVRLARELRRARPDVIIPYGQMPNLLMAMLWRVSGARVCVWNQRNNGKRLEGSRLHRWAAAQVPVLVANSREGAEALVRHLHVPASKVSVVPNGVTLPPAGVSRQAWRQRAGVAEDAVVACMVANLRPEKDHRLLLRAWASLPPALEAATGHPPILLLAGADAGEEPALRRLIGELGLDTRVRLLGMVDDVPSLLGACDVGVFASHGEGCPNGVLECMAAGLAVVATDLPGIREAMPPASDRWLIPGGDVEAMRDALTALLSDAALRARVGEQHRRRIEEAFSPQATVRRLMARILPHL